jgi:hypothetical protein
MIVPLSGGRALVVDNALSIALLQATDTRLRTLAVLSTRGRFDTLQKVGGTFFAYDSISFTMTLLRGR